MAFEKKTSSNSDRGKVRSAEELETYGVWVKSEPQDIAAEMAGAVNFGDDAVPFETGFDMEYAEREPSGIAFDSFGDGDFSGGFEDASFVSGPFENADFTESSLDEDGFASEAASEEVPAQLLLKIAGELSSIKSELDTIKKEVAEIRAGGYGEKSEALGNGFFIDNDDEKITLTDSEMDDILASSLDGDGGLDLGDSFGYSLRDEDEAALKELSRQNEARAATGGIGDEDGETKEDYGSPFGDIEEKLDGAERDIQDRFLGSEADNIFDTDLDFLTGEIQTDRLDTGEDDIFQAFADELPSPDTLEEVDELRDLRIRGADLLTPPPEDSSYLEEDETLPFNEDTFGESVGEDEDADSMPPWSLFETGIGEAGNDHSMDDEPYLNGEMPLDEALPLDDTDGEFIMDDMGDLPPIEGDMLSSDDELSIGEEVLLDDTLSLDGEFDDLMPVDNTLSLGNEFIEGEEISLDSDIGLSEVDDDLSTDGEPSLDSEIIFEDIPPLEEDSGDDTPSADDGLLSEPELSELDDEPLMDEISDEEPSDLSAEFAEVSSDDLLLDEPLFEDISLEMEGMESFDIDDPTIEDSTLMREIPEGFQVDAEEALVSDEDFETIEENEEISPPAGKHENPVAKTEEAGADANISPDLKKDLKDVLAYMDQLLESLPEDKIEEFAKSDHFDTYRKLFKELGLVQ